MHHLVPLSGRLLRRIGRRRRQWQHGGLLYRLRPLQLQRRTVGSHTHLAATAAAAAADCRCATTALILRWPRPLEAAPEGVFLIYNMLMDTVAGRQGQLHLCEDDVMCKCDSLWILEPWCHIEGNVRCINLGWTKYDVTGGLGVKCITRHWTDIYWYLTLYLYICFILTLLLLWMSSGITVFYALCNVSRMTAVWFQYVWNCSIFVQKLVQDWMD